MSRTEEKRAAFSLAPWKRLWRCVCQHRLRLALAIGSNLLLAVADFYIPLLQSRVVDQFILTGTTAGFGGYAVKYIGVCLFEIAMLLVYFKACMGLEMLSGRDMKEACFVNLQKLSLDYYNVTSAGHTLSRVMSDTDRIATCIAWVFPDILWGFAYILGVLGVMLSLSPGLAMTIIVIAPIVTALTVYFQKKLIALNRDVRAQHSKITSSYNEGIMGAKTSKTLALEGRLTDEFEQTTAQAAKAGILHGRMRAIYVPLIVLCGTLAASATLLRGGRMALSGRLSLGVLSAFMTYALSLFQTFRQQAAQLSMGDAYSDNLSPDKYDLQTPQRDLEPDHEFDFELDDGVDLGLENIGDEATGDYQIADATGSARVFADGALTEEIPIQVTQVNDDGKNELQVEPTFVTCRDKSKGYDDVDGDDVFHKDTLKGAWGRWYGFGGYYLVRYIGSNGKKLKKPQVTYFTVKDDVNARSWPRS